MPQHLEESGNLRPRLDFLFRKIGFEQAMILTDGIDDNRSAVEDLAQKTILGTHRSLSTVRERNVLGIFELPKLPAVKRQSSGVYTFEMQGLFHGMGPEEVARVLRSGPFSSRSIDRTMKRVGPKLEAREWAVTCDGPGITAQVDHFFRQRGSRMALTMQLPDQAGSFLHEITVDFNEQLRDRRN